MGSTTRHSGTLKNRHCDEMFRLSKRSLHPASLVNDAAPKQSHRLALQADSLSKYSEEDML